MSEESKQDAVESEASPSQSSRDDNPGQIAATAQKRWLRYLRPLLMPAIYTVLVLTVFWRLWTPIDNAQRSWKYDPQHGYWGDSIFLQDTLSEGSLAMWNPYDRGGFPVYGDPQPGLFYPPNWPLLVLGSTGDYLPFGIVSLKILLHWIFASIGMHLLIRRFGGKEPAAYTAGILFAFTSPKLRYMGSSLNWAVAWLPWVLLATYHFSEKPNWKRAVLLGSSLAMVLLSGAPAVVLYAIILALPLGLYKMWGKLLANWKWIALAAAMTLLWILPLMASNLEQLPESVRQVRSFSFINDSVFSPGHLATFLIPRLGQGENPYIGILAVLAIGLAIADPKRRGLAWVFLGIAAFAIAISFGSHAGVLPALSSAASPFSLFRRAHRYLYISAAALSVLAGLGLAHALSIESKQRKEQLAKAVLWVGGALSFALGIAYLVSLVVHKKIGADKNVGLGLAFLSACVFTFLLRLLFVSTGKTRTAVSWAIPLLVFFDIWTANYPASEQGLTKLPLTQKDGLVAELQGVEKDWRVYDDDFLNYRPGTRLKIRDFSGYEDDPLGLSRYSLFLKTAKRNLSFFGHANVRYFLDGPGKLKASKAHMSPIKDGMWELNKVVPAVNYYPTALAAKDANDALAKLRRIQPGSGAVVEGQIPQGDSSLPITSGKIIELSPNKVIAEIATPGPGLVVIAEAYYPKWKAKLDGKEVPIYPANLMFRGLVVDSAGHHRIELSLRPKRFWYLLPAYFAAFLALLGVFIAHIRQRKG